MFVGLCGQGFSLMRKATHRLHLLCWLTRRASIYCVTKILKV
ncbi:hypothetical protein ES288_D05G355200v1 [Gossypium darwinii]|uniref:Uncharacterized protein n=1 Tax=Gossypium darwinii TaxID=34276 RepID=A0A5D2CNF4_GOSDA|nr:hypothetical protein ES288_D05G355200v1 [Gossypium darwinii]